MPDNNKKTEERKLREISDEELQKILQEHKKWFESVGEEVKEGEKVDLRFTNLRGRNLKEACLVNANLSSASLQEASLQEANLKEAYLDNANLHKSNLSRANLQKAHLILANLHKSKLGLADLQEANLSCADLQEADLFFANLQKADLFSANFQKADLRGANLENADVTGVKYSRRGHYQGVRVATSYGSARFRRFAQDQDFIEELRESSWWGKALYHLWLVFADCGRTPWNWLAWSMLLAVYFGWIFFFMGPDAFHVKAPLPHSLGTMIYYSVVTFTTLGFGDITPKTPAASWWVMAEVVLGYIMLGGLISIFATKLARRS